MAEITRARITDLERDVTRLEKAVEQLDELAGVRKRAIAGLRRDVRTRDHHLRKLRDAASAVLAEIDVMVDEGTAKKTDADKKLRIVLNRLAAAIDLSKT